MNRLDRAIADAILGVDTLFGGDVTNPSGTGRFIADAWFSDEPLPAAYTDPSAAAVRASGGVSAKEPDRVAIDAYLEAVDVPAAIAAVRRRRPRGRRAARPLPRGPRALLRGDVGARPGAARARRAGALPARGRGLVRRRHRRPREPGAKRERVAALLDARGLRRRPARRRSSAGARERLVPRKSITALADAFIAQLDAATAREPDAAPAGVARAACRAPTSRSCRSRTPGSRGR